MHTIHTLDTDLLRSPFSTHATLSNLTLTQSHRTYPPILTATAQPTTLDPPHLTLNTNKHPYKHVQYLFSLPFIPTIPSLHTSYTFFLYSPTIPTRLDPTRYVATHTNTQTDRHTHTRAAIPSPLQLAANIYNSNSLFPPAPR